MNKKITLEKLAIQGWKKIIDFGNKYAFFENGDNRIMYNKLSKEVEHKYYLKLNSELEII